MRILLPALTVLLGGCIGFSGAQPEVARFDFGPFAAGKATPVSVASVEVTAPSWLAGSGIQYRLAYANAARRFEYGESRWTAPPGELLGRVLEARLAGQGSGRCRLFVELDEFVQVFESPSGSHWRVMARGALQAGSVVVARRSFPVSSAAPSPDARGGVAGAAAAVAELSDQLAEWISQASKCRQEP